MLRTVLAASAAADFTASAKLTAEVPTISIFLYVPDITGSSPSISRERIKEPSLPKQAKTLAVDNGVGNRIHRRARLCGKVGGELPADLLDAGEEPAGEVAALKILRNQRRHLFPELVADSLVDTPIAPDVEFAPAGDDDDQDRI